jgi:amylosucrase
MISTSDTARRAGRSLERLLPRIEPMFEGAPEAWEPFERRLRAEWPRLFELLLHLYGSQYDFFFHLEELLRALARSWIERPVALKALDARREADPHWFQSHRMVGGVLYVQQFSGTLRGLRERIPYFRELGLTYLHLMPLFLSRAGNSDGGYAISDYRTLDPEVGTTEELADLATRLRAEGISLVVDFVFNHTSDEHRWARRAQAGDAEFEEFYFLFPDRTVPDQYESTLREIFPTVRRGSFTWRDDLQRWVWTTFNSFQWDLNYRNPAVFRAMAEEMLFLANRGVEILRLDAVPFIWKQVGTSCENLPEAHLIIQAFNALAHISAPALLFKSEAIVHPDEVRRYVGPDECQISYNPLLMALLWEALATREVRLLVRSVASRHPLPRGCAWVNYLRSHDDIGWTFDDADAQALGMDAFDHRRFLNLFYTGQHEASFAAGVPFQFNPDTGDARVAGTLASLAGLEQALQQADPALLELSVQRILMLHGVVLSIGGIPLLYLGDELGTRNEYNYVNDPARTDDARWVHRPLWSEDRAVRRNDAATPEGRIFQGLRRLIEIRKSCPALEGGEAEFFDTANPHLFGYVRRHGGRLLLVVASFSEHPQTMDGARLRMYGMGYRFADLVTGNTVTVDEPLSLPPYGMAWLVAE